MSAAAAAAGLADGGVTRLDPRYQDDGCAYFSSCLGCHLNPCAEERGGSSVATEMLRLLRHNEAEFRNREPIGPPPELASARVRRAGQAAPQRQRRPASARCTGVGGATGHLAPHLVPPARVRTDPGRPVAGIHAGAAPGRGRHG